MPFVILDDALPDDPRVLRAGYEALGALVACLAYCNRALSDGFVPAEALPRLAIRPSALKALVAQGLLVKTLDGYEIVEDIAERQPTRDDVRRARALKTARQQRWRERRDQRLANALVDASTDASRDGLRDASRDGAQTKPPRPDPTRRVRVGASPLPDPPPTPPRCEHGRRLAADGAGCAECDQMPLVEVS